MARPREFDEKDVLDRALVTFWDKGYDGTSIDDLVTATGLGRASLYGAFGDKAHLFKRVMAHYCAKLEDPSTSCACEPSARVALERLMYGWVARMRPRTGPGGCFLLGASLSESTPGARKALAASNALLEKVLVGLVRRGQKAGEFRSSVDPNDLARLLVVVAQGLAASARAGWSVARLEAAVRAALTLVSS